LTQYLDNNIKSCRSELKSVLYFDCFAGASGDMILGALLDLGLNVEFLETELRKLSVPGYKIEVKKVMKSGLTATKLNVVLDGQSGKDHNHDHDHSQKHNHDDGNHFHGHNYHHDKYRHSPDTCRSSHHHRNLDDIEKIIEESQLVSEVKTKSIEIFRRLAEAEAKIHGTTAEKVHFHEVGAVDSIVDIVGAVIGLHTLNIDKIIVSPLPLGKGFVSCQHGLIPVPAPATLELLVALPTYGSDHDGETVTPTAAAILSTMAEDYGKMPKMIIKKVGYGAGTRDFNVPNLLRVVLGEEYRSSLMVFDNCSEEKIMK